MGGIVKTPKIQTEWKDARGRPSNFTKTISSIPLSSLQVFIGNATDADIRSTTNDQANALTVLFFRGAGKQIPQHWFTVPNLLKKDISGKTALHWAAERGWAGIPTEFLTLKNLSIKDSEGETPLQKALQYDHWQSLPILQDEKSWLALSNGDREKALHDIMKFLPAIPKGKEFLTKDWKHLEECGSWEGL